MARPDWDRYFMSMAKLAATRTTCLRRRVGCVLVKDRRVLATGYNGAPSGAPHCIDAGCVRRELNVPSGERTELCRAVHAEQNAVAQAARFGTALEGCTAYVTCQPCAMCMKSLMQAGCVRVVWSGDGYPDALGLQLAAEAGWVMRGTNELEKAR